MGRVSASAGSMIRHGLVLTLMGVWYSVGAQPGPDLVAPVSETAVVRALTSEAVGSEGDAVSSATVLLHGPSGKVTYADVQAMAALVVPLEQRAGVLQTRNNVEQLALAVYVQMALAEQARASAYNNNPQVQRLEMLAARKALSESWLAHVAEKKAPASGLVEQYARSIFENEKGQFAEGQRVHVRHLLVRTGKVNGEERTRKQAETKIQALLERVRAGEDFATLAKAHSEDPGSAERGGELSPFGRGRMAPEFEQAAFSIEHPGAVVGPIRTDFGYHLIQLIALKPAEAPIFQDHKNQLVERIIQQRKQQIRDDLWHEAQKGMVYEKAAIDAVLQRTSLEEEAPSAAK